MVTIIKRGKVPAEIEYQATCANCRTEFSFFRHEAQDHHDQRDGSCVIIACPLCSQDVWKAL